MSDESTYTDLQGVEHVIRYLMQPAIVNAKRLSETEWEVKGPWAQPLIVDDQSFREFFVEI